MTGDARDLFVHESVELDVFEGEEAERNIGNFRIRAAGEKAGKEERREAERGSAAESADVHGAFMKMVFGEERRTPFCTREASGAENRTLQRYSINSALSQLQCCLRAPP